MALPIARPVVDLQSLARAGDSDCRSGAPIMIARVSLARLGAPLKLHPPRRRSGAAAAQIAGQSLARSPAYAPASARAVLCRARPIARRTGADSDASSRRGSTTPRRAAQASAAASASRRRVAGRGRRGGPSESASGADAGSRLAGLSLRVPGPGPGRPWPRRRARAACLAGVLQHPSPEAGLSGLPSPRSVVASRPGWLSLRIFKLPELRGRDGSGRWLRQIRQRPRMSSVPGVCCKFRLFATQ